MAKQKPDISPSGRVDARFRIGSLFVLDLLFILAAMLIFNRNWTALALVFGFGAVLAIVLNVWLWLKIRRTEFSWHPGTGSSVLRTALDRLGSPRTELWVKLWQGLSTVGLVLNVVAVFFVL